MAADTKNGSTLSYEQACEQAWKMHQQGISYPKIAAHFKAIGYRSAKTKDFPGHLTARHMAELHAKRDLQELKDERLEDAKPIAVVSPVRDTLAAVEQLLAIDGIPDSVRIRLVKNFINESKGEIRAAAAPAKRKGGRPKGSKNKAEVSAGA